MAKYKIIPSSRTIVQLPISIGHKAEKGVEAIEFDVTAWVETYGSGTLTVIMRRWGDAIPYPIALEIDENNKATWTLSDTDTAKAGMAYAQLSYIVGDEVVKKSDIYTFRVMDSLTGEGEPPEAYESWLEHLTHLAAEAMAEVLDIEGIVTDKTLSIEGGIADAKATGEALAKKVDAADYSELSNRVGRNTIALAEKADRSTTYTKEQVNKMISDVEVETDTTLEIAGAAADAAETGRQIGLIKADLGDVNESLSNLDETYALITGTNTLSESDFVKGGIGNSGEDGTYMALARARNVIVRYTAEKLTFNSVTGYKIYIATYANTNISSWISSTTLGYNREVPANTYYRLCISKVDGTEATISELLSQVTVTRDSVIKSIESDIVAVNSDVVAGRSLLAANGGMILYFEHGSIGSNGADSDYNSASRMRTALLAFGADLEFKAKDTTQTNAFVVVTYDSNGTFVATTGWIKTYKVPKGTKFRIIASLTPNANTPASVSDIISAFSYTFDFAPSDSKELPTYYFENDYIDGKIETLISYYSLAPDIVTFGFVTDTHMLVNAGQTFKLFKYIDEHTNSVPFVIFGGDCIGHTQSKDDVYAQAGAWIDYMDDYDKRRVLQCRGNHDLLGDQDDSLLTRAERYMYLVRNQDLVHPSVNNFYYYYDIPYTNTRLIVVDDYDGAASGGAPKFTQTQLDWILGTALNAENKNIIFVTHNTSDPDVGWYSSKMEPLQLIMDALKTKANLNTVSDGLTLTKDFTDDTNTLICCLCGHGHDDESHTDASGVLTIMTNCDGNAKSTSGYDRTVGTVNEQCFEVVTIDITNKHIYLTRIGAGADRDFVYS